MPIMGGLMAFLLLTGTGLGSLPAHANAPVPVEPSYSVTMTAYNAVPEQTDDNPLETASGLYANPETVAARSRDLADTLPFGTIIEVIGAPKDTDSCGYAPVAKHIGYRIVADTMNARYSDRIDVLLSEDTTVPTSLGEKNATRYLGVCTNVVIRVVGHVDMSHPSRIPATQKDLASFVHGTSGDLAVK